MVLVRRRSLWPAAPEGAYEPSRNRNCSRTYPEAASWVVARSQADPGSDCSPRSLRDLGEQVADRRGHLSIGAPAAAGWRVWRAPVSWPLTGAALLLSRGATLVLPIVIPN